MTTDSGADEAAHAMDSHLLAFDIETIPDVDGIRRLHDYADSSMSDAEAQRIHQQTVLTRVMPIGNLTNITEDERELIDRWYQSIEGSP